MGDSNILKISKSIKLLVNMNMNEYYLLVYGKYHIHF